MPDENELLAVARRLFDTQTKRDAYEVAVASLARLTAADECAVAVLESGELVSRASVTEGLIDASEGPLADDSGLIEQAYRERETILVADLTASPCGWQFPESDPGGLSGSDGAIPYRSLLCLPLEPEGILVATADQSGAFDRETRRTADEIGSLVEAALDAVPDAPESASEPDPDLDPDRLETVASTLNHEMMDKLMIANNRLEAARDAPKPEHFDQLAAVHDRIETFVEDTTRYLRTGERIPDPERLDLGTVAEQAWRVVETPGIELQRPDALEIVADEGMVSVLLENLFRNAATHGFADDRSASDSQRVVSVGRLTTGRGIYIEDNGRGIDPEYGGSVFESGVTTAADGSGQGLSICRDIATAHGWEITVAEADSGGARFEITGVEFAGNDRNRSGGTVEASGLRS
jgi:signal transduction histidine kinase